MKQEFEKFYRRYHDMLSKYVYRRIGKKEPVEDIVQEVFCLAYEKWGQITAHPTPEGWLILVARNKMLEFWRNSEYRQTFPLEGIESELCVDDENYGMVEIEAVAEANLQMGEWNLMKSYYWEDRNVQILAEQAGVENSCMRMRISRITRKLRTVLKGKVKGAGNN